MLHGHASHKDFFERVFAALLYGMLSNSELHYSAHMHASCLLYYC
jgi:hypothetical protein